MARLIDADKLNSDVMLPSGEEDEEFEFVTMFAIEHAPTVDAVEVVRCKDCKYLIADDGDYCCDLHEFICKQDNDYCSWGERREDGKAD